MSRKASEVLKAAKARIQDPKHWCKGFFGRLENGEGVHKRGVPVPLWSAHSWCARGAIYAEDLEDRKAQRFLTFAANVEFGERAVVGINDNLGHEAVMRLYDKAIELAEESERSELVQK